jgi:hypothetical protein
MGQWTGLARWEDGTEAAARQRWHCCCAGEIVLSRAAVCCVDVAKPQQHAGRTRANSTGASALIMRTSSSDFMICEDMGHVWWGAGHVAWQHGTCFMRSAIPAAVQGSVPRCTHLLYACQRQLVVFEFCRISAHLHRRRQLADCKATHGQTADRMLRAVPHV